MLLSEIYSVVRDDLLLLNVLCFYILKGHLAQGALTEMCDCSWSEAFRGSTECLMDTVIYLGLRTVQRARKVQDFVYHITCGKRLTSWKYKSAAKLSMVI